MTTQSNVCDTFTCVLGVNEGYFHVNEVPTDSKICEDILTIADQIHRETGIYIGVVVVPVKVLYKREWGCPAGGELVFILTGNNFFNSKTEADAKEWRTTVKEFLLRIKAHFKQSTIQVEWVKKTITRYETE